jgi:signal transduction histidine kinase
MAHEKTVAVGLEKTVRKLIKGVSGSGGQLMIDGDGRSETRVQSTDNIEKTAHDFRASLNIVIGFTDLILDEVMGKINAEQRRSLNDILNHAKRLRALSDDIIKRLEAASEK